MSKTPNNNLKDTAFFPSAKNKVSKSRKRTRSMMSLKKPANIHLAGIQYESSSDSEWQSIIWPLFPKSTDNSIVMSMQHIL